MANSKSITYNGKTYKSINQLAKEYNIDYQILYARIHKRKWSIEKAITTPIKKLNKTITYKNKTYTSISKLANEYNISDDALNSRLKNGWSIEKAITKPVKDYSIIYENKTYSSITELAKKYNIPDKTLRKRINEQKWSVKRAIETPIKPVPPKGFKIIKLAYTHNNIDYYECIHNNQKYILSIEEMKNFTENTNGKSNKSNNV